MTDLFWDRIEPHNRDPNVAEGLSAAIGDPLWMLARQWQVGEFRGEDAASPIHLRMQLTQVPIDSFRNGADPNGAPPTAEPMPRGRPLEARVEAEQLPSARGRCAVSAAAGIDLRRRLFDTGLKATVSALQAARPLEVADDALAELPDAERTRFEIVARSAIDGLAMLELTAEKFGALVPKPERSVAVDVWQRWAQEQTQRLGVLDETWVSERLEHRFEVAATQSKEPVVLTAEEYPGGRLDWYAFDIDPKPAPHRTGDERLNAPVKRSLEALAVPLTYAGAPASRYWQFEEGTVYFGGIEAGPADLGRLLVAEFAIVYSDDWFLFPVRVPVGNLARIEQVTVATTFGERNVVRSCAQWDHERGKGDRRFAMYELSGDDAATKGRTPWLALLPSVASTLHSKPLEVVSFVRDEMANLAWAIEERIETADGHSLPRRLLSRDLEARARDGAAPPANEETDSDLGDPQTDEDEAWRYRTQSMVPPFWVPLVPERPDPASAQTHLRRARMLAWQDLEDPSAAGPKGSLLTPDQPFVVREEEVPRGGVQVSRQWQTARGVDGSFNLWLARRKRPGRGERGSGLEFDRTLR